MDPTLCELFCYKVDPTLGELFCYKVDYTRIHTRLLNSKTSRGGGGIKLSGTENELYDDLDIPFTDVSISAVPVIILGDFNIHFNNALKSSRLRNLLQDFQLTQHVSDSTHENGNTVDLVIIRMHENLLKSVVVCDYALSDHHTVECTVNINKEMPSKHFSLKRSLQNIDMNAFASDLTTGQSVTCHSYQKFLKQFGDVRIV